eukprot:403368956
MHKPKSANQGTQEDLQKILELTQKQQLAIQAKKKKEILDKALQIADQKHKLITQLTESKQLKQNFEKNYNTNPFGFNFNQKNSQAQQQIYAQTRNQPGIKIQANSQNISMIQQDPNLYQQQYMAWQQYYMQQQRVQQMQLEQFQQQQKWMEQQKHAQEAIEQVKLMQLEPMRQLRALKDLQDRLSGAINGGMMPSDPFSMMMQNQQYGNQQNQPINNFSNPQLMQQQLFNQQPQQIYPQQQLDYGLSQQNYQQQIQQPIYNQDPQSYQPQQQLQQISEPLPQQQIPQQPQDPYNLFDQSPSKYQSSQHKNNLVRTVLDTQIMKVQKKDLGELEKKKRRMLLEYQNLKKKNDYLYKMDAQDNMFQQQQSQEMYLQQQQIIQQQQILEQQKLQEYKQNSEEVLQHSMSQQQDLMLKLMNEMQAKKEDHIKEKNQRLLNKIKKEEIRTKQLKNRINQSILIQLQGGSLNQNNSMDLPGLQGLDYMMGQDDLNLDSEDDDVLDKEDNFSIML